nr:hypothetical protein [Brachybacterium sp. Z12]
MRAIVPEENLPEARLVDGLEIDGAAHLAAVLHRYGADVPFCTVMGPAAPLRQGPAPAAGSTAQISPMSSARPRLAAPPRSPRRERITSS